MTVATRIRASQTQRERVTPVWDSSDLFTFKEQSENPPDSWRRDRITPNELKQSRYESGSLIDYDPNKLSAEMTMYGLVRAARGEISWNLACSRYEDFVMSIPSDTGIVNEEMKRVRTRVRGHLRRDSASGGPHNMRALRIAMFAQSIAGDKMPVDEATREDAENAFPYLAVNSPSIITSRFKRLFGIREGAVKEAALQLIRKREFEKLKDFQTNNPGCIDPDTEKTQNALAESVLGAKKAEEIAEMQQIFPYLRNRTYARAVQQKYEGMVDHRPVELLTYPDTTGVGIEATPEFVKGAMHGLGRVEHLLADYQRHPEMHKERIDELATERSALHGLLKEYPLMDEQVDKIDATMFMDGIRQAEDRGDVLYFSDNRNFKNDDNCKYGWMSDGFGHLPWASSYDESIFKPDCTLETPPEELLKPVSGHVLWQGIQSTYTKVAVDVPGDIIYSDNSRKLSKIGGAIVARYKERDGTTWLELGPGAGVGASQVHHEGITVDSVAMNSTNPDYCLNKTWEEILKTAARKFHEEKKPWEDFKAKLDEKGIDEQVQAGIRRIYYCTRQGPDHLLKPAYNLGTRVVFGLATLFPEERIITKSKKPFLRRQYIGFYPDISNVEDQYQVLNDDNGPIWHESRTGDIDGHSSSRSLASIIMGVYRNIAEDGCLVCSRIQLHREQIGSLKRMMKIANEPEGSKEREYFKLFVMDEEASRLKNHEPIIPDSGDIMILDKKKPKKLQPFDKTPFIFARKNSPIAEEIRLKLGLKEGEGGVHEVDNVYDIIGDGNKS